MVRVALLALLVVSCTEEDPPVPQATWRSITMPEPRLETGAGALGSRLILAGGFSASMIEGAPISTEVLTFDTLATGEIDPWGALPPLPVAWTHANVAAVGGVVFVLGGLDGLSFVADGRCFVLEAGAMEWTEIDPMPAEEARGASAVVVSPGHIFLIGGSSTFDVFASGLDFDIATRTFSRMPVDLPIGRSHAAAIRRADGTFIVAGGLGGLISPQALGDVWALPQDATTWLLRTPMPTPRGGCAYGEIFGNLVCAGGESGPEALDVVELYTFAAENGIDRWDTLEPIPARRAGARGAVVANRVYVPGGSESNELTPTDTLFELSLTAR